jgi:nucleotide-binding universal stress UspA family protein
MEGKLWSIRGGGESEAAASGCLMVATDGSEQALRILPHAAAFARRAGWPLVIGRVVVGAAVDAEADAREMASMAAEIAEVARQEIGEGVDGFVYLSRRLAEEDVWQSVLRMASELEARALAIQSRGANALSQALLGSVASRVLDKADLPVLIGGPALQPPRGDFDKVLVCVDVAKAAEAMEESRKLSAWLAEQHLQLSLLHVYERHLGDPAGEGMEEAGARLRRIEEALPAGSRGGVSVQPDRGTRPLHMSITRQATEQNVSAIAMTTGTTGVMDRLLQSSTTHGVLGEARVPLIVLRSSLHQM